MGVNLLLIMSSAVCGDFIHVTISSLLWCWVYLSTFALLLCSFYRKCWLLRSFCGVLWCVSLMFSFFFSKPPWAECHRVSLCLRKSWRPYSKYPQNSISCTEVILLDEYQNKLKGKICIVDWTGPLIRAQRLARIWLFKMRKNCKVAAGL